MSNILFMTALDFGRHIVFPFAVHLSNRLHLPCPASQLKPQIGFLQNFMGMISTKCSCAFHLHVPLGYKKQRLELKIGKSYPAFTAKTAGQISTKLHRNDQYQVQLCMPLACSASLHNMAARARNRKILSGFHSSNHRLDFYETSQE